MLLRICFVTKQSLYQQGRALVKHITRLPAQTTTSLLCARFKRMAARNALHIRSTPLQSNKMQEQLRYGTMEAFLRSIEMHASTQRILKSFDQPSQQQNEGPSRHRENPTLATKLLS